MPPTTKPTSGLLALRAAAADTGELRSAALPVFFDREQTRAGDFRQQWDMIFSLMSLLDLLFLSYMLFQVFCIWLFVIILSYLNDYFSKA